MRSVKEYVLQFTKSTNLSELQLFGVSIHDYHRLDPRLGSVRRRCGVDIRETKSSDLLCTKVIFYNKFYTTIFQSKDFQKFSFFLIIPTKVTKKFELISGFSTKKKFWVSSII